MDFQTRAGNLIQCYCDDSECVAMRGALSASVCVYLSRPTRLGLCRNSDSRTLYGPRQVRHVPPCFLGQGSRKCCQFGLSLQAGRPGRGTLMVTAGARCDSFLFYPPYTNVASTCKLQQTKASFLHAAHQRICTNTDQLTRSPTKHQACHCDTCS